MPQRGKVELRGQQAAGDGATSRSVKAFQFGGVGKSKKNEPSE